MKRLYHSDLCVSSHTKGLYAIVLSSFHKPAPMPLTKFHPALDQNTGFNPKSPTRHHYKPYSLIGTAGTIQNAPHLILLSARSMQISLPLRFQILLSCSWIVPVAK